MFEEIGLVDKVIWFSFIMPVVLSLALLWFFIIYKKRKNEYLLSLKDQELKRQGLIIERQNALENERRRIASEMHDDLGGGLTIIKFLGQKVLNETENENQKAQLLKILTNAQILVENMSEIIWAMNSENDRLESLISYIRRYTFEFLDEVGIKCDFRVDDIDESLFLSGEQRRNIFLIVKEILNNIAKHANAKHVQIMFSFEKDFEIMIRDDGVGFDEFNVIFGNGLTNIDRRIKTFNGDMKISNNQGAQLEIRIPIDDIYN